MDGGGGGEHFNASSSTLNGRDESSNNEAIREMELLQQYRAKEAQLAKQRTALQPFQFLGASSMASPASAVLADAAGMDWFCSFVC